MSPHLGLEIADLLDGRLTPERELVATAHLQECDICRDLLENQTLARDTLRDIGSPAIPLEVVASLYKIEADADADSCTWQRLVTKSDHKTPEDLAPVPATKLVPRAHWHHAAATGVAIRPRTRPKSATRRIGQRPSRPQLRGRATRMARQSLAGFGFLIVALVGTLYVQGGSYVSGQQTVYGAEQLVGRVDWQTRSAFRVGNADQQGVSEAALNWMAVNGWVTPSQLPPGFVVTDFALKDYGGWKCVVLTLDSPSGSIALVVHHAAFVVQEDETLRIVTLGGRTALVDSAWQHPQAGMWGSGPDVVAFVSSASDDDLGRLIEAFPAQNAESLLTRITRAVGHVGLG